MTTTWWCTFYGPPSMHIFINNN